MYTPECWYFIQCNHCNAFLFSCIKHHPWRRTSGVSSMKSIVSHNQIITQTFSTLASQLARCAYNYTKAALAPLSPVYQSFIDNSCFKDRSAPVLYQLTIMYWSCTYQPLFDTSWPWCTDHLPAPVWYQLTMMYWSLTSPCLIPAHHDVHTDHYSTNRIHIWQQAITWKYTANLKVTKCCFDSRKKLPWWTNVNDEGQAVF